MHKLIKKILIMILCAGVLVTSVPAVSVAYGAEYLPDEELIAVEENTIEENITEGELLADEEVTDDEGELLAEEELTDDEKKPEDDESEESYVANQVFALCDTETEAYEIADEYSAALGHEFTLTDYDYGVATYIIDENPIQNDEEAMLQEEFETISDSTDMVNAAVSISADDGNELTEVYADFYAELAAVERPDTDREGFSDPYVKSGDSSYQWYHEMVGDKYVWEEMELLNNPGYDGPLRSDFADNLKNEVVAVIDSGLNMTHEDFTDSNGSVIAASYDVITGDAVTKDINNDGHGTNVAGIIANAANNKGGRGVASGVRIMPINVCPNSSGTGITASNLVKAVNVATEKKRAYKNGETGGINICAINISICMSSYSAGYRTAVREAYNEGIVIVGAAGNNDNDIWQYPAAFDEVISVASVNPYYVKSAFSSYGDRVDISAPGGEKAGNIEELEIFSDENWMYASGNGGNSVYIGLHGTSQASPVVAAAAALVCANNPGIMPSQVKKKLTETARTVYPSYKIGSGCVDVAAALGITENGNEPMADIESGRVPASFDVNLTLSGISDLSEYKGGIYFTLDGSDPDLSSDIVVWDGNRNTLDEHVTYRLNLDNPIPVHFEYTGDDKVENLKVMSVLFGQKSRIVSYRYEYSLTDNKVVIKRTDGAPVIGNKTDVSVGGLVQLSAVDPETGKTVLVKWDSSNKSVANVLANGMVQGVNSSSSAVTITATPVNGSLLPMSIDVNVLPKATKVEILPPIEDATTKLYDKNTVLLFVDNVSSTVGRSYDLSDKFIIYPENAIQEVTYTSSNPNVATVSSDGIIRPIRSGLAVITVMAADGSRVYDTINVKCEVGISDLDIKCVGDRNYLISGGTLRLNAVINNGTSTPSDSRLTWDFTDDSKAKGVLNYASINKNTGVIIAKSYAYVNNRFRDVEVVASSEKYGVSATYECVIYPAVQSIQPKQNFKSIEAGFYNSTDRRFYFKSYKTVELSSIVNVNPVDSANSFTFKSSDENVARIIPSTGDIDTPSQYGKLNLRKPGKAIITMTATDGSNRSVNIPITVFGSVNIVNQIGIDSISPGKSLSFSLKSEDGSLINGNSVKWSVSGVSFTDGRKMIDYVSMDESRGILRMDMSVSTELNQILRTGAGKGYDYYIVKAEYSVDKDETFVCTATRYIKIVPTLPTAVRIKNEADEDISAITLSQRGEKAVIKPYALPEGVTTGYVYTSSNPRIATINDAGEIEAVSKGVTLITVRANDLSRVQTILRVTVSYPYVQSIKLSATSVNLRTALAAGMTDPEGCKYSGSCDFTVTEIAPADADREVSVSSLNEKVARVSIKPGSSADNPVYTITPVGRGYTMIRVMAADGSGRCAYVTVNVVKPNTNLTISPLNGNATDASRVVSFRANVDTDVSNRLVRYYYYGIGETDEERQASVEEMKKYATLYEANGMLAIKPAAVIGTEARTVYVYAQAQDEWKTVSEPVEIKINPGIVYINNLYLKSSTGLYDVAAGGLISLSATCNADATDRGITWHVYDENPSVPGATEGSDYVTMYQTGLLTANRNVQEKHEVYVVSAAKNGGYKSSPLKITVYPSIKSLSVDSYPASSVKSVDVGDYLNLKVTAVSMGTGDAISKFKVTYTTGAGKVYLDVNPETGEYDGSRVKIYGLKRGSTIVIFTALDGSNRTVTYCVTTN